MFVGKLNILSFKNRSKKFFKIIKDKKEKYLKIVSFLLNKVEMKDLKKKGKILENEYGI